MVKRLHVEYHDAERILTECAFQVYNHTPWSIWVIVEPERMYFALQEDFFGVSKVVALCKNLNELNAFLEKKFLEEAEP